MNEKFDRLTDLLLELNILSAQLIDELDNDDLRFFLCNLAVVTGAFSRGDSEDLALAMLDFIEGKMAEAKTNKLQDLGLDKFNFN